MNGFPSLLTRVLGGAMQNLYGTLPIAPLDTTGAGQQPWRQYYATLLAMYNQNNLYDGGAQAVYDAGIWREALKPLRNPAFRTVEFYVARVWPGSLPDALPIETDNAQLPEAVEQVWSWSNWGSQKQVFVRWAAIYGDVFVKVAQRPDRSRVYFQLIDPHYVADFDTDERGYLTYIRIDTPLAKRVGDKVVAITQTEVWDKARGDRRVWEYETKKHETDREIERLGPPLEETPLSAFSIDFIPIVHSMFRDLGEQRGRGAYSHALDKIIEHDRQATRLHQMLFRHNKNTWVLEGGIGSKADGRNIPPPQINGLSGTSTQDAGAISVGDESFYSIPSPWTLKSAVPELDYAAALSILQAHGSELEQDLPELAYSQLRNRTGDLSGRTVRLLLSDAIDRVLEVRGNCEGALVRLQQMALTIGKNAGLFPALGGTFEEGAFDHSFEERDVLPPDRLEEATARMAEVQAAMAEEAVTDPLLLKKLGYTDEEIRQREAMRQQRMQEQQEQMAARPVPDEAKQGDADGRFGGR